MLLDNVAAQIKRMAGYVAGDGGLNPLTGEPLREERFRISDNYTRGARTCVSISCSADCSKS